MEAAREDLKHNRLDAAHEKAAAADNMNIAWDLFDRTPKQLLARISRQKQLNPEPAAPLVQTAPPMPDTIQQTGLTDNAPNTVVEIPDQPEKGLPQVSDGPLTDRDYSRQLLAEARQLMREGHFDDARDTARKAARLNLTYELFDDTPENVLREIDRRTGTITLVNNDPPKEKPLIPLETIEPSKTPGTEPAPPTGDAPQPLVQTQPRNTIDPPGARPLPLIGPETFPQASRSKDSEQAQRLLAKARESIEQGFYDNARRLVTAAASLNAEYGQFDERPEVVLGDINRAEAIAKQEQAARQREALVREQEARDRAAREARRMAAQRNGNQPPAAAPTTGPESDKAARAARLLAEARVLIRQGNRSSPAQRRTNAAHRSDAGCKTGY